MDYLFYEDFGIALPVTPDLTVLHAPFKFEDRNLFLPTMADYFGCHGSTLNVGIADYRFIASGDKKHLIELDFFPNLRIQPRDFAFDVRLYCYLCAACLNYRTHYTSCFLENQAI